MADDLVSFGAWVRLRRQALVLTRDELAGRIGVAEVTVRKVEADERRPSPQVAELLALLYRLMWRSRDARGRGPTLLEHTGAVHAVTLSPDGTQPLTGANVQTARLWSVRTGQKRRRVTTQSPNRRDVSCSFDGTQLLLATGDTLAQLRPAN